MAAKKATSNSKALAGVGTKDLAAIDAEMSQAVANIKDTIGQSSGNRLSLEVNGDFTTPDGMNLGNEIQIVVVDYMTHHKFYTTRFNKDNPAPPDCYAMGRVINEMVPEDDSPNVQHENCRACPMNQFGSGENGKSKACQNRRLLAVLVVDPENPDAHNAPDAPIYTLDLSPSNNRPFDGFVSAVARSLAGLPVKALVTVIGKNVGTYATLTFVDPVPNPDYAAHYRRRGEVQDMLTRRPDFAAYAAKAPPARGGARGAPAPKRGAPSRR